MVRGGGKKGRWEINLGTWVNGIEVWTGTWIGDG